MNYSVGQILYVVFKKDNKVIPVQVTEEITRRTLEGMKVDYTVQAGPSGDSSVSLEALMKEAEVFNSPEHAIEILSERACRSISKLVQAALSKSVSWYGLTTGAESVSLDPSDSIKHVVSQLDSDGNGEERVTVTLPDGTVARVKLPQQAG